jgi:hypothetical protein
VVYVTAHADEQTLAHAGTPTPVLAVSKPLDNRQLLKTLSEALGVPLPEQA